MKSKLKYMLYWIVGAVITSVLIALSFMYVIFLVLTALLAFLIILRVQLKILESLESIVKMENDQR